MTFSAAELYEDHELSDVIVAFRDYEVPAHRLILSCRSTWFRAALKLNIRGFLRLHVNENDVDIVASMLSWIYTSVYPPFDAEAPELWRYHLRIAAMAEKYGVATLWEAAMESFDNVHINNTTEAAAMLHALFAYHQSATHPCDRTRLLQPEEFLEILQEAEDTTFCTEQPWKPLDYISLLADAVAERTEVVCEEQATVTKDKLFSGLRFSTNDLREVRDAAVSECQAEGPQESMVYVTLLADAIAEESEVACEAPSRSVAMKKNRLFSALKFSTNDLQELRDGSDSQAERHQTPPVHISLLADGVAEDSEEVVREEPAKSAAAMRNRLFSALRSSTSNLREAWKAAVGARLENHGEDSVGCEARPRLDGERG
ncbi:hypothetical protein LTR56_000292 [Elasticomyces elasticus]|nr:hypothetical protein LTR56_000292 [Elasticomyces elasticus]KAK3667013.1 hypothetical protein LTR22_002238 [Elasticomyces elasticus]KAK4933284.1 hypothetical protein LTR49_000278 [Elasticomyces elasticus]KAK5757362.1 hypothetical protein LTS12_012574 [Elasticomyces elasticus]